MTSRRNLGSGKVVFFQGLFDHFGGDNAAARGEDEQAVWSFHQLGRGLGRGVGALAGEIAQGGPEGDSAAFGVEGGQLVYVLVEGDGGAHGAIMHQFED